MDDQKADVKSSSNNSENVNIENNCDDLEREIGESQENCIASCNISFCNEIQLYPNGNDQNDALSNENSTTLHQSLTAEISLPVNTLNNVELKSNEQNSNSSINNTESETIVNNEVFITKEVITINSEVNNFNNEVEMNKLSEEKQNDLYFIDKPSSLGVIATEYDSSDSENEIETQDITKVSNSKIYRDKNFVLLDSGESADSESDSSSSSESDSSSEASATKSTKSIKSSSDDSDNENKPKTNSRNQKKLFKPKGEFDDLPPIEDLKISVPEVLCDPLGEVAWTVDQMVVVRPKPGKPTLNLDTILFMDKGQRALGHIFDVFGKVAEPHYCVRFNSSKHIQESDIKVGMTVYFCPNTQYTSLVFLSELTKMKAIDEVGDDEPPQFSDDEEEQAYLASLKTNPNANKVKDTSNETPNKRKRGNISGWQSNHPWNNRRDHMQNVSQQNPQPFYRTHHPWSRPRYPQQQNSWHFHNSFPNNQWMHPYPSYNEIHTFNNYLGSGPIQHGMEIPNVRFPQMQWSPQYQTHQNNPMSLQGFPPALVSAFTLPPPPPPPPPPNTDT